MNKHSLVRIASFLFIVVLFSSCGNFEKIEIGEPGNFNIKGFEDNYLLVNVDVPVSNPTMYRIKIKEIDVRVFLNGRYIGKLFIDEEVVIKGKENRNYELPVKVRLNNLLGTAFIMMSLKKGQSVEVKFEGAVTAKSLLLKKTVEIDDKVNITI